MLATMSTRWGIPKSFVKMAFFGAGRDYIQSRVSVNFSRVTMNSVHANPSKLPNAQDVVPCKQRLNKRRSKYVWSTNSDGTHCPNTRRRLPKEWLIRRWSKQLTRQAQCISQLTQHWKFLMRVANVTIQRCHANSPINAFIPGAKKGPSLRLVRRIPRCSSRVILPNWCNKTKTEGTSHWEWWTKTRNKLNAHRLRGQYGTNGKTNQDLVARPRNIHFESVSGGNNLSPELIHQFITSVQTQHAALQGGKKL